MQVVEPFDLNDCIQLINQHRNDIKGGNFDVNIKREWVNQIDDSTIRFLAEHSRYSRCQIAEVTTSIKILEMLSLSVAICAIKNPNITPEIITTIFDSENYGEIHRRSDIAKHPKTPIKILKILAKDEESNVRESVAYNSKTPPDILVELANDSEIWVRREVAGNKNTPPQTLAMLARTTIFDIRNQVAANPSTPTEILGYLAKNPMGSASYDSYYFDTIKENVASNPNAPTQYKKSNDKSKESSCFIATAAYGSYLSPEVILLSKFRDEILLNSVFGKAFVRFYYFVSPPLASVIAKTEFLRSMTRRIFIAPILCLLKAAKFGL
ncbi:MAG: CFI-box-CTERM domain-containing protein [Pyrinomonadaceae bacterium]